jgi:ribosomal protein L11 methyltransferase
VPFLQFTLDIGARDPEPYEAALFDLGALSVTLLDAADNPVLEPAPGQTPLWPTVVVRAHFDDSTADAASIERTLRSNPILEALQENPPAFVALADRAWEREWLKDFRPMRFGRRLWVCPAGQPPGSPDAIRVELDPGMAFGTGTHATTALCLEWLDSGLSDGWLEEARVIDYGCGSGILAIAALKLGAAHALAMDIDPQALLATGQNAARNNVLDRVQITADPNISGPPADVLLANILAGPLVDLAPLLARCVRPGGRIAVSGLLLEQAQAVAAAYEPWFDIVMTGARDGWGLLAGCRRDGEDRTVKRDADVLPVP